MTVQPALTQLVSVTDASSDQRQDAAAGYDLTRTTITNGEDQVEVVQQVRDLRGGDTQVYGFNVFVGYDQYIVHVVRRRGGTVFSRFVTPAGEAECDIGVRWRIARNSIRRPTGAERRAIQLGVCKSAVRVLQVREP